MENHPTISNSEIERSDHRANIEITSSMSMTQKGATISFHDINYAIEKRKYACCGGKTTKDILKHVNGICHPGMNAILGPTGSGKTSLLDVLAGRKDPNGLTGQLLIDGNAIPKNFKCMVGYVVQEDIVMGTLTVRENLMFSANLRLPSSYQSAARAERVDELIEELGLSACANTKVGNEFIRGISGGEKKRTNIGMELVIAPPLLFLDEPTTGLDSSTASAVMMLLRNLALRGRTVIFSIHQPRFSIFKLFDAITLLSKGEVVFQGPAQHTLDYFQEMGYVCEEHNNPSDLFLDIISGDSIVIQPQRDNDELLAEDITDKLMAKSEEGISNLQRTLVQNYHKSTWNTNLLTSLEHIYKNYQETLRVHPDVIVEPINYRSSVLRQFWVVSGRGVKGILRNPQASFVQVIVMILFALIVGAIYYQLDDVAAIQNRRGALFFIVMNQVFANLSAVELFIQDRALFIHENASGYYRVSSYYFSKLVCDIIPMRAFPVIIFSAICYWMVGLRPEVDAFFIFTLTLFLTDMAACGVAFAISASVRIFSIANLLIALVFVFMMVFGGLLVQLDSVADWISWLKWLSIFRYSLEGLSIIELRDRDFCGRMNITQLCDGNEFLTSQGINYETGWDLWSRHIALAGVAIVCLLLTYIQLLRVKKLK